jgi:hypothetical protein
VRKKAESFYKRIDLVGGEIDCNTSSDVAPNAASTIERPNDVNKEVFLAPD